MEKSILIGNGLNQCIEDVAWNEILNEFAKKRNLPYDGKSAMQLPLEFEKLIRTYIEHKQLKNPIDAYGKAKRAIAKVIAEIILPDDIVHHKLKNLCVDNIITTNYDFLLEKTFNVKKEHEFIRKKVPLVDSYTSKLDGMKFYHPHGAISNPTTMCLGYAHYVKIINRLQHVIAHKYGNKTSETAILKHLRGEKDIDHWATHFFDSDMAILGFGLDYSEIDMWWILSYRSDLIKRRIAGADKIVNNKITYYDTVSSDFIQRRNQENISDYIYRQSIETYRKQEKNAKHQLLRSMNVEVKTYELDNSENQYKDAYSRIIEELCKNGVEGN